MAAINGVHHKPPASLTAEPEPNALELQVGGSHYKNKGMQPVEFSMLNGVNACQHSIVKYLTRNKHIDDLKKAAHFCELWLAVANKYELRFPDPNRLHDEVAEYTEANSMSTAEIIILELILCYPSPANIMQARDMLLLLDEQRRDSLAKQMAER